MQKRMEIENLIKLIETVSASELTGNMKKMG